MSKNQESTIVNCKTILAMDAAGIEAMLLKDVTVQQEYIHYDSLGDFCALLSKIPRMNRVMLRPARSGKGVHTQYMVRLLCVNNQPLIRAQFGKIVHIHFSKNFEDFLQRKDVISEREFCDELIKSNEHWNLGPTEDHRELVPQVFLQRLQANNPKDLQNRKTPYYIKLKILRDNNFTPEIWQRLSVKSSVKESIEMDDPSQNPHVRKRIVKVTPKKIGSDKSMGPPASKPTQCMTQTYSFQDERNDWNVVRRMNLALFLFDEEKFYSAVLVNLNKDIDPMKDKYLDDNNDVMSTFLNINITEMVEIFYPLRWVDIEDVTDYMIKVCVAHPDVIEEFQIWTRMNKPGLVELSNTVEWKPTDVVNAEMEVSSDPVRPVKARVQCMISRKDDMASAASAAAAVELQAGTEGLGGGGAGSTWVGETNWEILGEIELNDSLIFGDTLTGDGEGVAKSLITESTDVLDAVDSILGMPAPPIPVDSLPPAAAVDPVPFAAPARKLSDDGDRPSPPRALAKASCAAPPPAPPPQAPPVPPPAPPAPAPPPATAVKPKLTFGDGLVQLQSAQRRNEMAKADAQPAEFISEYEKQRLEQVERNNRILASLGLTALDVIRADEKRAYRRRQHVAVERNTRSTAAKRTKEQMEAEGGDPFAGAGTAPPDELAGTIPVSNGSSCAGFTSAHLFLSKLEVIQRAIRRFLARVQLDEMRKAHEEAEANAQAEAELDVELSLSSEADPAPAAGGAGTTEAGPAPTADKQEAAEAGPAPAANEQEAAEAGPAPAADKRRESEAEGEDKSKSAGGGDTEDDSAESEESSESDEEPAAGSKRKASGEPDDDSVQVKLRRLAENITRKAAEKIARKAAELVSGNESDVKRREEQLKAELEAFEATKKRQEKAFETIRQKNLKEHEVLQADKAKAEAEAKQMREAADEYAKQVREKAEADAKQMREAAEANAKQTREKAEADAKQVREHIATEIQRVLSESVDTLKEYTNKYELGELSLEDRNSAFTSQVEKLHANMSKLSEDIVSEKKKNKIQKKELENKETELAGRKGALDRKEKQLQEWENRLLSGGTRPQPAADVRDTSVTPVGIDLNFFDKFMKPHGPSREPDGS